MIWCAVTTELQPLTLLRRKDAASIYDLDKVICNFIAEGGVDTVVLNNTFNFVTSNYMCYIILQHY
jgi:hypothetical protein